MTRYTWLDDHERHLAQGDAAALRADLAYCRDRAKIAQTKHLKKTWEDRMRAIEKALAMLDSED